MTFIKACPSCSSEIDLDGIEIEFRDQIQCPYCYETISIPTDFWPLYKLEDIEA